MGTQVRRRTQRTAHVRPTPPSWRPTRCGTRSPRSTDRQRIAIVLRFYEDMPDDRIAEILDCRQATVRSAIHRGLQSLRQVIVL